MTKIAEISEQERKEIKKLKSAAYYQKNKERIRENGKRWYAENKEIKAKSAAAWHVKNRGSVAIRKAKWEEANKEKSKLRHALWYQANKELVLKRSKEYATQNPEKAAVKAARRRTRKKGIQSEPYTTQLILELYGTDCHLCKEPIDLSAPRGIGKQGWERSLHLDHVVSLFKGGTDLIENIRPSHGKCNVLKHVD